MLWLSRRDLGCWCMRWKLLWGSTGASEHRVSTSRRRQRRWGVVFAATSLLAIMAVTMFGMWLVAAVPFDMSDRLVLLGDLLTASTVLLALVGGLIALGAYAAATGRPDLEVEIVFRFCFPNRPVLELEPLNSVGIQMVAPYRQSEAQVVVHNRSRYSARNPAVRIRFVGFGGIGDSPGWSTLDFVNMVGPTAVQWEGGADYAIHGNWTRALPMLDFAGVAAMKQPSAELRIDVVADGFRSETRVPVELLDAGAYRKYSTERAASFKRAE